MKGNLVSIRRIRKSVGAVALLVAVTLAFTACSSGGTSTPSTQSAGGDYKVLLLTSVSGSGAAVGAAFAAAYKAGAGVVNETKGVDGLTGVSGRTVTVKVIDDGSDPQVGVTAMQTELASGTQYDLVVPGTTGAISNAVVPTLASTPNLQMSSAPAGVDAQKYPLFYSTGVDTGLKADGLIKQAKTSGATHVGVMAIDNAATRLELVSYQKAGEANGVKVDTVFVPSTTGDATPQLQQLLGAGVDLLIFSGFDPQTAGVSLIKAKAKLRPTIPVFADISYAANGLKAAGITNADLSGVTQQALNYLVQGTPESSSDLMKTYLAVISKESRGKTLPLVITTIGAMTVVLAADASVKAKSVDGTAAASALGTVKDADIPRSIGPRSPFANGSHIQQFTANSYVYIPMSLDTTPEGLLIPGRG